MATYPLACPSIEAASTHVESLWGGQPPLCLYSCSEGTDAHWQLWHPQQRTEGGMPSMVLMDGWLDVHPDAPSLA